MSRAIIGPARVDVGVSEEQWNVFSRRWVAFALGSSTDLQTSSSQLFQCAPDELENGLLKSDPGIIIRPADEMRDAMTAMTVIAVATGVNRAELVLLRQERDESFRSFTARVFGKANTCAYSVQCACPVPTAVDFTEIIVRDVLIAGIADMDILGTDKILERTVNEVVIIVEGKEMARNALPSSAPGISSFKRITTTSAPAPVSSQPRRGQTTICLDYKTVFALFSEGARGRGWNTKPHRVCRSCYRARRGRRPSE